MALGLNNFCQRCFQLQISLISHASKTYVTQKRRLAGFRKNREPGITFSIYAWSFPGNFSTFHRKSFWLLNIKKKTKREELFLYCTFVFVAYKPRSIYGLKDLRYADDTALLSTTPTEIIKSVKEHVFNIKKTKIMDIGSEINVHSSYDIIGKCDLKQCIFLASGGGKSSPPPPPPLN